VNVVEGLKFDVIALIVDWDAMQVPEPFGCASHKHKQRISQNALLVFITKMEKNEILFCSRQAKATY